MIAAGYKRRQASAFAGSCSIQRWHKRHIGIMAAGLGKYGIWVYTIHMNSRKKFGLFVLMLILSFGVISCVSVELKLTSTSAHQTMGTFRNNSTVRLNAGYYTGNFSIDANSVTLVGQGVGRTIIDGDIRINGNNSVLRQLSVRGNVYINGNNADLSGSKIEGRVFSSGRGNRW